MIVVSPGSSLETRPSGDTLMAGFDDSKTASAVMSRVEWSEKSADAAIFTLSPVLRKDLFGVTWIRVRFGVLAGSSFAPARIHSLRILCSGELGENLLPPSWARDALAF